MEHQDPLLKTQQVAGALKVSGSTIKRWVDSGALGARRTIGKHRLIPLSEALEFARRRGFSVAGFEGLAHPRLAPVKGSRVVDEELRDELFESLILGDIRRVRTTARSVVTTQTGAIPLADQLIRPVMQRLGDRWKSGSVDVYHEHQATQIVTTVLSELIQRSAQALQPGSPVAVGASPESDPYLLPLQLGELVLRENGWDVRNLGVNLPLRSLSAAVWEYRPRLVFLSISHLADEDRFAREYREFHESVATLDVAVMLGGRALGEELRTRLIYAGFGERMAHLAEFARRLAPRRLTTPTVSVGGIVEISTRTNFLND